MLRAAVLVFASVALAGVTAASVAAQESCQPDSECSFKKPNILVVMDYSSSMVGLEAMPAWFPPGQTATKRWDAQLDAAAWILRYDDGFFADNARIGLARFAHDPDVATPGTVLSTDVSYPPITDGFALDVPFDGSDGEFLECKGSAVEAEIAVLRGTPPPSIPPSLDLRDVMLTWTRGALARAHQVVRQTRERHRDAPGEAGRQYEVVLMTDGDWTCPDSIGQDCPQEDPASEAAILKADGIRTHVVAFADAAMQPSLDEVALQGGTNASIDATSPEGIIDALASVLDDIRQSVIVPECTSGLPRVLLIMDGSSSMIEGGAPGETKWDMARFAVGGNPAAPAPQDPGYVEPIFSRTLDIDGRSVAIEDVVHLGLMTFSDADTQVLLSGFGPCMRDNFAWAMDPATSCVAPGCTDPYAGFPIDWTFQDSADGDPAFVRPTRSFMPACNDTPGGGCIGQIPNTFTGQGLQFARQTIADYRGNPAPFQASDSTRYVNILITDGRTSDGSSDVQSALQEMVTDGVDTYVIGFGSDAELDVAQLQQYAAWGNTGQAIVVDPGQGDGADALAGALQNVIAGIDLDACCVLEDCSEAPEPADPGSVCGDGRIDPDEQCDDGPANATYGKCSARCDGPHLFCGDDRVDGPEECDDGNATADDGCSPDCMSEDADAGTDPVGSGGTPPIPPVIPPGAGIPPAVLIDGATLGMDAGTPEDGVVRRAPGDDGCGCSSPGSGRGSGALGWVLLAVAVLIRRRR